MLGREERSVASPHSIEAISKWSFLVILLKYAQSNLAKRTAMQATLAAGRALSSCLDLSVFRNS